MTPGEEALWSQANAWWVIAICVLYLTVVITLTGAWLLWDTFKGRWR